MVTCSIIICTRDRATSLGKTLQAMDRIDVPAGWQAEAIVVDNGSTDDTADVVAAARLRNMACRCVNEPRLGQCHARNAGIAAAGGDMIVFTDDDVIPSCDWLEALCAPIIEGHADAVAGEVVLAPDRVRHWMTLMHRNWLASTERPPGAGGMPRMVGANMAFSRRVLRHVPRFDTELGPGRLGFGDDVLFGEQLRAAGYRVVAAPRAVVEHHFEVSRLTRSSFLASARKHGRTMAYIDLHWRRRAVPWPRARLAYAAARLAAWRLSHPAQMFQTEGAEAGELYHVQTYHYFLGLLREQRRHHPGYRTEHVRESTISPGPACG